MFVTDQLYGTDERDFIFAYRKRNTCLTHKAELFVRYPFLVWGMSTTQ
jgi:hypothetical protein